MFMCHVKAQLIEKNKTKKSPGSLQKKSRPSNRLLFHAAHPEEGNVGGCTSGSLTKFTLIVIYDADLPSTAFPS